MTSRGFFLRLAMAGALAAGLTTAAWAWGSSGGCCANGKYRMPNGKLTNVFPARKATGGKKQAAMPARPKAKARPKPRKKVNFTAK